MLYVPTASTVNETGPAMLESASQPGMCSGFSAGTKRTSAFAGICSTEVCGGGVLRRLLRRSRADSAISFAP
jgi:hypothetical protein